MGTKKEPSAASVAAAEELWQELKPTLVEMIERGDPAVENLKFDDIEAHAAAVGDLLAKLMMVRTLGRQPSTTVEEEQAARKAVLEKVSPAQRGQRESGDLRMTHIPKRARKLKTARGEITFEREYLYFPELKTGVFPPGDTAGDTRR